MAKWLTIGSITRHTTDGQHGPPDTRSDTMDNYRTIATKLANREPFTGNSLRAYWVSVDGQHEYQVVSYNTIIGRSRHLGNGWVNPDKFSNTTSRGQNLIKRAWGLV